MENLAGIKMFSADDLCKGFHIAKETAYAIMKQKNQEQDILEENY